MLTKFGGHANSPLSQRHVYIASGQETSVQTTEKESSAVYLKVNWHSSVYTLEYNSTFAGFSCLHLRYVWKSLRFARYFFVFKAACSPLRLSAPVSLCLPSYTTVTFPFCVTLGVWNTDSQAG